MNIIKRGGTGDARWEGVACCGYPGLPPEAKIKKSQPLMQLKGMSEFIAIPHQGFVLMCWLILLLKIMKIILVWKAA